MRHFSIQSTLLANGRGTDTAEAVSESGKLPISVVCMTYNEERNIEECLLSVVGRVAEIVVIDSFSTDRTLEIVSKYTDRVYQHEFKSQSAQLEWALRNVRFCCEWILRLDADERWTPKGFRELKRLLCNPEVNGVYVKMKIFFMGRWIRHGDFYPNLFLRVFRSFGHASVERRWMDEHVMVRGKTVRSDIDVIESNYDRQQDLSLWIDKHNKYSTREAIDQCISKYELGCTTSIANFWGNSTQRKRWLKENFYSRLPLFVRPLLYFVYRYFYRLGFLDGLAGLVFHVLQGFWYRFLVDAKVYQLEKRMARCGCSIQEAIRQLYGVDVAPLNEAKGDRTEPESFAI
jgi:glycosyltransferase involved in cell wall biosynthesis